MKLKEVFETVKQMNKVCDELQAINVSIIWSFDLAEGEATDIVDLANELNYYIHTRKNMNTQQCEVIKTLEEAEIKDSYIKCYDVNIYIRIA